jgi:hypothetical protein
MGCEYMGWKRKKKRNMFFLRKKRSMSERERWLEHERCKVFFFIKNAFGYLDFELKLR